GSYSGHVFTGFGGALASTMVKILPKIQNIDTSFLYYILTKRFSILHGTTVGTGIPHVNKMVFENLPIQLPPFSEQQTIAHILSTADKRLKVERKRKEKLERIKKALMDLLLTGKIRVKEMVERG
ncbi:MAG: restriction endonuclease subunit S, partial [Thermoplasmata archaeon]